MASALIKGGNIVKREEVVKSLQEAADLKDKVLILINVCSEVANYLTAKLPSISILTSHVNDLSLTAEKLNQEQLTASKTLELQKKQIENDKSVFEEWKKSQMNEVKLLKDLALTDREDARNILSNAKTKQAALNSDIEEFEKQRRTLSEKHEKIKALAI